MAKKKPKYYVRPDGLHEAIRVINGKRIPFRGRSDAEVERKMIEYREKQEKGPLLKEVAERWKNQHFPTLAISTVRGYTASYNRAIERFGDMPIRDLMPSDIDALLQYLARQQYSRKVVATQLVVINLICKYAILEGTIRINPCTGVSVPKGLKYIPRALPTDEELEIVKNGWNKPGGLLPYFILYSGCRKGEALALEYADIDHKRKIIRVNKSLTYDTFDGGRPIVKKPKTDSGTREIILLDKLAAVLPRGIGNALVFPGVDGGYMRRSAYEHMWNRWQKSAGVSVTAHQLRHGFATMLFEAGIDERDAMDLLGHADIKMTKVIYAHIRKSRKEKTAAILNKVAETF